MDAIEAKKRTQKKIDRNIDRTMAELMKKISDAIDWGDFHILISVPSNFEYACIPTLEEMGYDIEYSIDGISRYMLIKWGELDV